MSQLFESIIFDPHNKVTRLLPAATKASFFLQMIIFGPKIDEVIRGWRKLHNEELYNMYSSPGIIKMIKSRKMRWEGHVARMVR
jgi:hypothetical protein